jgi:UDP-glucose 4-epimerase
MAKTVLITGVAGFIGSHVADSCLRLGMEVIGLDDLSGGFRENVPSGVHLVEGSVTDAVLVDRLFREHSFRYVYHLAAYAAEGLSHFIRRFNYETNLVGSINVLNAAVRHEVECLVFTSSIAVYGPGQTPMSEESTPLPEDPYGISKYAVELDLEAARRMFGLQYVVFRPHNVYGERQNIADRYRNVIGIFMNQTMQGLPMTVFGDGTQTRAFSYVADVAPIIARAPEVPSAYNQAFNIGADTPCSVNDLATEVARAFGVERRVTHLPPRTEVLHAFSSHEKVARAFGAGPGVSLREGISRMAEWAKRRGSAEPIVFREIELRKNLPPSWTL